MIDLALLVEILPSLLVGAAVRMLLEKGMANEIIPVLRGRWDIYTLYFILLMRWEISHMEKYKV